jgi:hypothetical protein
LRTVPKWGREILPFSIPETVVGLIPASSASRTCVHMRDSLNTTRFLLVSLLSTNHPFIQIHPYLTIVEAKL